MRNKATYIIVLLFLLWVSYLPIALAQSNCSYSIKIAHADGSVENYGENCYSSFSAAKNKLEEYPDSIESVPFILKNNEIVYTRYGTVRLTTPSNQNITIFNANSGSASNYGYFNGFYSSDALFLDYCPTNNRVQIQINGRIGWINISNGEVKPFSNMNANQLAQGHDYVRTNHVLNIRTGPSLTAAVVGTTGASSVYRWLNKGSLVSANGFQWYKIRVGSNDRYIAQNSDQTFLEEINATDPITLGTYYFKNSSGDLRFRMNNAIGTSTLTLGPAPSFMAEDKRYYSFDSVNYYLDFSDLVKDVRAEQRTRAVNQDPYYNYYLFLSHRSISNYSAQDLNNSFASKYIDKINRDDYYQITNGSWERYNSSSFPTNQSMLYDKGASFKLTEHNFGTNALLSLGVAINESAWGRSNLAVRSYNLFGHGAYDSAPGANAFSYSAVSRSIEYHATGFVATYLNPASISYFGPHLGTKQTGMNYRYASDAYWGKKAAANYYIFDRNNGMKDYGTYLIGAKQITSSLNVRANPNTSSPTLFSLKNVLNYPVLIIGVVEGETINGSNIWYKIQTDVNINEDRQVERGDGSYNFATSYGYVPSAFIHASSEKPHIVVNKTYFATNEQFDPLEIVSAFSLADGDLTNDIEVIENTVNTASGGTYKVVYRVTDSNKTTTREVPITVLGPKTVKQIISESSYSTNSNTLRNVNATTSINSFRNALIGNNVGVNVSLKNAASNNKTSGYIATGDKVTINTGTETKEYTVIIRGDIIGDGEIGLRDLLRLQRHLLGNIKLAGNAFQAADMNNDKKLDLVDLLRIQMQIIQNRS